MRHLKNQGKLVTNSNLSICQSGFLLSIDVFCLFVCLFVCLLRFIVFFSTFMMKLSFRLIPTVEQLSEWVTVFFSCLLASQDALEVIGVSE